MSNNSFNIGRDLSKAISKIKMRYLIFAGIAVIVIGFLYDLRYAGIPDQDPPLELLEKYNKHKAIAEVIIKSGFGLLVIGVGGIVVKRIMGFR